MDHILILGWEGLGQDPVVTPLQGKKASPWKWIGMDACIFNQRSNGVRIDLCITHYPLHRP